MPGRGGGTETETGPHSAGASLRPPRAVREAGGEAGCKRTGGGEEEEEGVTDTPPHAVRSHEVTTSQNTFSINI